MKTVPLPDGHHAVLREAKDMPHRSVLTLRKAAQDAIGRSKKWQDTLKELQATKEPDAEGNRPLPSDEEMWAALLDFPEEDREPFDAYYNRAIELVVKEWDEELARWLREETGSSGMPGDLDSVENLPEPVRDALIAELTGVKPMTDPDFTPDGAGDPKAPTPSSNGSSSPAPASQSPTTPTTPTAESIPT